jgi:hypothetical protein
VDWAQFTIESIGRLYVSTHATYFGALVDASAVVMRRCK